MKLISKKLTATKQQRQGNEDGACHTYKSGDGSEWQAHMEHSILINQQEADLQEADSNKAMDPVQVHRTLSSRRFSTCVPRCKLSHFLVVLADADAHAAQHQDANAMHCSTCIYRLQSNPRHHLPFAVAACCAL